MQKEVNVIVYGIGNPGRRDDGLGPRLVSRLLEEGTAGADFEIRYQLSVEEAWSIKDRQAVIFADASMDIDAPVKIFEIHPSDSISFTTHEMAPESVLALCLELFGRAPRAFVLAIKGAEWEMGDALSEEAERNLTQATAVLKDFLKNFG